MPTSPDDPDRTPVSRDRSTGELAPTEPIDPGPEEASEEEERLVSIFESMLVRHEEVNAGPSLTQAQITIALKQHEAEL